MNPPYLDVRGLIAYFGGRTAATKRLKMEANTHLSPKAIDQWVARQRIPAIHLQKLIAIGRNNKRPLSIKRFLSPTPFPKTLALAA